MKKHLRDNKTCLNCGATVEERYCSHCGQENTEPKESFSHLLRHFFEDITHYDSKFFITIKDLLFKPGFLTKEYLAGKRANYLHPIRLYVFISFLYFLLAFSFSHTSHKAEEGLIEKASYETRKHISDSVHAMILVARRDTVNGTIKEALLNRVLAKLQDKNDVDQEHFNFTIISGLEYKLLRSYDSLQKSLPPSARDHNIKSWLYSRWFSTLSKYGKGSISLLIEKTQHTVPKMMFILLPMFALSLTTFYSRRAYFYTDHAIFSLHFHAAVFLLFLFLGYHRAHLSNVIALHGYHTIDTSLYLLVRWVTKGLSAIGYTFNFENNWRCTSVFRFHFGRPCSDVPRFNTLKKNITRSLSMLVLLDQHILVKLIKVRW